MKNFIALLVLLGCCAALNAQTTARRKSGPDCSGGWPTQMAFVKLKNAGLADANSVDLSKTKTERLASQPTETGVWRQVYLVTFAKKSGGSIVVIAMHDASEEECSLTDVDVYVVSQHLSAKK